MVAATAGEMVAAAANIISADKSSRNVIFLTIHHEGTQSKELADSFNTLKAGVAPVPELAHSRRFHPGSVTSAWSPLAAATADIGLGGKAPLTDIPASADNNLGTQVEWDDMRLERLVPLETEIGRELSGSTSHILRRVTPLGALSLGVAVPPLEALRAPGDAGLFLLCEHDDGARLRRG